jgi:hypothetical protein
VAQDVERIGVVRVTRRHDRDLLAVLERQPQVLNAAVRPHKHSLLGQLRPDRTCGVEPCCAARKFEFGAVGENDLHGKQG